MSRQSSFWERKWKFNNCKGQTVHLSQFLSDSFVLQGEFHKCTCSSPPQNGSSNRKVVTVAGAASTHSIGIRWQTSHKGRRSQQCDEITDLDARLMLRSFPSTRRNVRVRVCAWVMSTPLLLLRWPFTQSCIPSSVTSHLILHFHSP